MITAEESFSNLLRAAAALMRMEHGPGCPEFAAWRRAASLLTRVADAAESGSSLPVGERDAAIRTARDYLAAGQRAGVPA